MKQAYLTKLRSKLSSINGYEDAVALTGVINTDGAKFADALQSEWTEIDNARSFWRWTYLIIYVIGAAVVLAAGFLEWRSARDG